MAINKLLFAVASVLLLIPDAAFAYTLSPSEGHEAVNAQVLDATPAHFTINLKKLANLGVDQKASTFALYTTSRVPQQCGDFSKVDIDYLKPEKYERVFDLSQKPEVLKALNEHACVIIPNKPKR